jgi:hypothetical protein
MSLTYYSILPQRSKKPVFWALLAALSCLIIFAVIVSYVPLGALLTGLLVGIIYVFVALHAPLWVSVSIAIALPLIALIGLAKSLMVGGGIAIAAWLWHRFRQSSYKGPA